MENKLPPIEKKMKNMKQELQNLALNTIHAKENYRKTFNDKSLKELAQSIKENGVLEPIIVRPNNTGYEIIAGERRFRAANMAKLVTIPAIIRDATDTDVLKIQLIENVQREGVPYMEEAYGFKKLRDDCSLDIAEISKITGKSDALIYNLLSLTRMSEAATDAAVKGELGKQAAILISRLPNAEYQDQAANALRRKGGPGKHIEIRNVRRYIEEHFEKRVKQPRRNAVQKLTGVDYRDNWKKYLVNFTCEQFEAFKKIVHGRTETDTLAEAVDVVMRGV